MRSVQAEELAIASTAPDSRWQLAVGLCCPSSPTSEVGLRFFKRLEVYWFISAGREVDTVLIITLGLFLATVSDSSHNLSLGDCQLAEGCW